MNLEYDRQFDGLEKRQTAINPHGKAFMDLTRAIQNIIDNAPHLPITMRAVHYQLLSADVGYTGIKKEYNRMCVLSVAMRRANLISQDAIFDPTRASHLIQQFPDVAHFIENEKAYYLTGYNRRLLQSQPYRHIIVCEKETVAHLIKTVANKFGIYCLFTKGQASEATMHSLAEHIGEAPTILYAVTDHDPTGLSIYRNYVLALRDKGCNVYPVRVAVTREQIEKYNLPYNLDVKEADANTAEYKRTTGLSHAFEIDALPSTILMRELENAIIARLDAKLYQRELKLYKSEQKGLEAMRAEL